MDTNELKEKRLNIMSNDRTSFEEKLAVSKNVYSVELRTTSSLQVNSSDCSLASKAISRR